MIVSDERGCVDTTHPLFSGMLDFRARFVKLMDFSDIFVSFFGLFNYSIIFIDTTITYFWSHALDFFSATLLYSHSFICESLLQIPSDAGAYSLCSQLAYSQTFSCSQVQVSSQGRYNSAANESFCLEIIGMWGIMLLF